MTLSTPRCAVRITIATTLLTVLAMIPAGAAGQSWQRVGTDARSGVSGLAIEGPSADGTGVDALIVHDNKAPGQRRLSRVTHRDRGPDEVTPLTWSGAEPQDLEAIEAIPGMAGEYMALAARGIVYRVRVDGDTAAVVDYAPLPGVAPGDDDESLALVSRDGRLAVLWASRGDGPDHPAVLYAAPLTFAPWGQPEFAAVSRRPYRAPYPTGEGTRHITDLSVTDSGRILASSAADAGDDGPFDSAVSDIGRVTVSPAGAVRVTLAKSPTLLGTFHGYRVEAVECVPGTDRALLGTGDGNHGGSVRSMPYCGR
ncbi:hypothetical protein AB0D11_21050 [Streptomyces monashensis]|uniref:hypothetical protein n=1 Tax=Streptomyces monashensis TaxID=1678012 RepID=UPI0033F34933